MKRIITVFIFCLPFLVFSQEQEIIDLYNQAEQYNKQENYKQAAITYELVLNKFKNTFGKSHEYYVRLINILARVYKNMGDYQKALPLYLEALESTENKLGKEHPDYGIQLNELANLYDNMGKYQEALNLYIEALENTEDTLGKSHPYYGTYLTNLATLYERIGEYQKALPLLLEALENTGNALGKSHPDYGNRLNNLASLYKSLGDYRKALTLYQGALENIENALGKTHSSYGTILSNLALLYESMGDYKNALPLFLEALEIRKNTLGTSHPSYGISLNNLALLYQSMNDYQNALPLYQKALVNTKHAFSKSHPNYGSILNNLANLYSAMGGYQKALPLVLEALEIRKNTLGTSHPSYGISLNSLADIYINMGDYQKALPLYLETLENAKNTLGKLHPNYASYLSNLAFLYQIMGDYEKVLPLLIEFDLNIQNQIEQNFSFLNEKNKEAFIKNEVSNSLNVFSHFNYISDNSYLESVVLATNNILTSKGLLLNASKNILSQLESLNDEELNEKILQFRAQKAFINNQLQLPLDKLAKNFNVQKENLEALESELIKLYSSNYGEDLNYVKDWKQTKLKDNELAIEFTYFDIYDKTWTDSTMYVAYLYKNGWKTPKVINLFEEKQLKNYISSSTSPKKLYKTRGSKGKNVNTTAVADSIYKLVWKPLEKFTKNTKTIYYSPDGLLHKISFAALPNEENKLLGEVYELNQMGNTADIRKFDNEPNLTDALLIGGIDYTYLPEDNQQIIEEKQFSILDSEQLLGSENNKRSTSSGSWSYLKGTQQEIDRIKELLPSSKVLNGKEATETTFKSLSGNSPSILHIATHGYFFPDLEKKKDKRILDEEKPYVYAENPLLRSGLILANANYAWKHGNNPYEEDDGILTALEISNLDLKKTDIVILSACETGLGDIPSSEGVYGLQRAFKIAGVNTIIMSLWEVPDEETAEFMNLFYTKWKAINDPKKAFKEAQSTMMKKYRDNPEKWAAFVLFE